jgi:hypothetical protein
MSLVIPLMRPLKLEYTETTWEVPELEWGWFGRRIAESSRAGTRTRGWPQSLP